jgi:predicted enzyme involved in methoxymalonyl-ACP biosynthesis
MIQAIRAINNKLIATFGSNSQVKIFDYEQFTAFHGKKNLFDIKLYYQGDLRIAPNYLPHLAKRYADYALAKLAMGKKALVLDLDNTLWGGIIGEDGLEGIKLSPNGEGKPFYDFQRQILALYDRGVILC